MANMTRHVGKIKNTGVRCIVVLRKMPGATNDVVEDRNHALVIETESLPDMYHDNLMTVINSNEAQQTHDLYSVLARRSFGDGSNIINSLHAKGMMRRVSVDDVILFPMPNQPLPLRLANDAIDGITTAPATAAEAQLTEETKVISPADMNASVARNLLIQAELLEIDAAKKREEAFTLDPSLRPQVGRPELSKEEKELRRVQRNEKRRQSYAGKKEIAE